MHKEHHIHVVGAGLAGLSTALHLAMSGFRVSLYEASLLAGGRCRSYFDRELGCRIDNGNHLVLSGNMVMMDYLFFTGAEDTLAGPDEPVFPFADVAHGGRWVVRMNKGMVPWWIFSPRHRVPETRTADYASIVKLFTARDDDTIEGLLGGYGTLYKRFWEPLTVAVLNTEPANAAAKLMTNVFAQTFGAGGKACMPRIPKIGLSETFVDPCLKKLQAMKVSVHLGQRLRAVEMDAERVNGLNFGGATLKMGPKDWVVLATPAWVTGELVPALTVPNDFRAIVNAHYRIDVPRTQAGFCGIIGGVAEWIFAKPGVVSVTVSAAERYVDLPASTCAAMIWADVAKLYGLDPDTIPPHRIVKEKRATFAATPEQVKRRPRAWTQWKNLVLAGDWTDTSLPSTIEGSIRSGLKAAQVLTRWAS
ncbi:MAG: NAD(P)-binding protein [Alphaproteobacteria bacterium]|nr:NAD(P)-binding protein [Alphaproteobacteria bacterium]